MNIIENFRQISASITLLVCGFQSNTQTIITCDSTVSGTFGYPTMSLRKIVIDSCHAEFIEDQVLVVKYSYDINMLKDTSIYGYSSLWPSPPSIPSTYYHYNYFGTSVNPDFDYHLLDTLSQGLTCDETDHSFAAGKGITKYSTTPCCDFSEEYLGDLPPDMQCLGDITYRRGKFYMSAIGNKLVEVNMKDPSKSQVVMYFPPGTLPIHGLATVQTGCDSMITYAIGREYSYSKIYEIDFSNWSITEVCQVDKAVTGAGAQTECMLPPCTLFVDLDNDNSSLAFWGNYCADAFCLPPMAVTDTDVVILSMSNSLDSLELELTGILNGASEYLETNIVNSNLSVLGNGSPGLVFINNGAASLADFEDALKSVSYQNGAAVLSYGMRHVKFTGWSGGVASIVSTAELPLDNNVLQVTSIATAPNCHGELNGSLEVQTTGGIAPYTYQWQAGQTGSLLSGIGAGSFPLIVMDSAGCVKSDTFSLSEPDTLTATISYAGFPEICNTTASLTAVASGGTIPYTFNWDNGVTGAINNNIGAGDYVLTVFDSNGCQASAGYSIMAGDTVLQQESAELCAGQSINWNGLNLGTDTLVCIVYIQPNGCDSTVCLALVVHPLPMPQITSSGSLCNGAEVTLSVGPFSSYQWSSGENSPDIAVGSAGLYEVTVTNAFGCSSTADTVVSPGVTFDYSLVHPTCFGEADGSISVGVVSSGTAPFLYSIDGVSFQPQGDFQNLPGGNYLLVVQDATGCSEEIPVQLDTPPDIVLDAGDDEDTKLGEPVVLTATTNLSSPVILWQPSDFLDCSTCLSVTANPPYSIEYVVTASDGNGCFAQDTVAVNVTEQRNFYIPNAFSPNDDAINDGFTIFSDASVSIIASLEIFDRWGERIFLAMNILPNDPSKGWDGMFHQKRMPPGVYVFSVRLVRIDGTQEVVRGEVSLVR